MLYQLIIKKTDHNTQTNQPTVAATILKQLGGNKFLAMTGARQLVDGGNYLQFRIMRNKTSANVCIVFLEANDTYSVTLYRVRGVKSKMVDLKMGVYNDNLQAVFTSMTGLNTHL